MGRRVTHEKHHGEVARASVECREGNDEGHDGDADGANDVEVARVASV